MKWLAMALVLVAAGTLPTRADWVQTTGGTYDYGAAANWTGGISNNVFLPSTYNGTDQTITLATDGVWNPNATVVTAHTNATTTVAKTVLLKATGSDRNLVLGAGVTYQGVVAGQTLNRLQFGTVTANEKINFTLPQTVTVQVNSDAGRYPQVIFNGALGGAGGINKTGNGSLYLQNAASTFTGTLNIGGGWVALSGAGSTLATTNIIIGRQDAVFLNSSAGCGVIGLLALGNGTASLYGPYGSGSVGANTDRIPDNATVELRGGNLRMMSKDGNNNSLTETVGTVNLIRGVSGLGVNQAAAGITNNVITLAVTHLNRTAGTGLTAANGASAFTNPGPFGTGSNFEGRITLGDINGAAPSAAMINGIIPWAVNADQVAYYNDWAPYREGDFLTYGSYGLTPQNSFVTDINTVGATPELDNYKITTAQDFTTNRVINSLTVQGAGSLGGWTKTLTVTSGALNISTSSPNGGRNAVQCNINFNGREAIINMGPGPWQLSGVLANTGGNGVTFNMRCTGWGTGLATPSVVLPGYNTYTGPTTVNGGLLMTSNSRIPVSSRVVLNEGSGIDMQLDDLTIASLAGMGYVWFQNKAGSGNHTLTVGSDNTSTTYAGTILDHSPSYSGVTGSVVKAGTGVWTLSGTNGYTGATTVSGGGLVVNGALTACTNVVTGKTNAFLGGVGTIARNVMIENGGLLASGLTNTVGTLSISSNLNLQAGAVLDVQITDTNSYDRIAVGGSVNLNSNSGAGSTLRLSVTGTLRVGQQFTVIDNQSAGAVQGTFSAGNGISANGYRFVIAYNGGTGNDVVLTVRPKGTLISVW